MYRFYSFTTGGTGTSFITRCPSASLTLLFVVFSAWAVWSVERRKASLVSHHWTKRRESFLIQCTLPRGDFGSRLLTFVFGNPITFVRMVQHT